MRLHILYEANFEGNNLIRIEASNERLLTDVAKQNYRELRAESIGEENIFLYEDEVETDMGAKEFLNDLENLLTKAIGREASFTDKTRRKVGLIWKISSGMGYCKRTKNENGTDLHERVFPLYRDFIAACNGQSL
jgi:hypothetical protein